MYIWVVLATFVVAIYSYNLSHRPDMKEMVTLPQAEAIVGKMVTQHKAAKKYLEGQIPPYNDQSVVSFFPGELYPDDELEKFLPYGFINDRTQGDFRTLIYCLDKNDTDLGTEVAGCSDSMVSCCSSDDSTAFLITFGCVPRKWRNPRTGKPKVEFFKALRNFSLAGTEVGYAEFISDDEKNDARNTFHSDMAIRARNINFVSIPKFIVDGQISGVDLSFSDVCGNNNIDDEGEAHDYACDKCLIYMSPISY